MFYYINTRVYEISACLGVYDGNLLMLYRQLATLKRNQRSSVVRISVCLREYMYVYMISMDTHWFKL